MDNEIENNEFKEEKFISKIKEKCLNIKFEVLDNISWNSPNGLKYVSDDIMILVEKIFDNSIKSIELKKNPESEEIVYIWTKTGNLCTKKNTTKEVIDAINNKSNVLPDGTEVAKYLL